MLNSLSMERLWVIFEWGSLVLRVIAIVIVLYSDAMRQGLVKGFSSKALDYV